MPAKLPNFKSFAGTRGHRLSPHHTPPGQFTRRRSQVRVLSRPPCISGGIERGLLLKQVGSGGTRGFLSSQSGTCARGGHSVADDGFSVALAAGPDVCLLVLALFVFHRQAACDAIHL